MLLGMDLILLVSKLIILDVSHEIHLRRKASCSFLFPFKNFLNSRRISPSQKGQHMRERDEVLEGNKQ